MITTINCIFCYNPETSCMGGHVHKDNEQIIACICDNKECQEKRLLKPYKCQGCFGEWNKNMGIEDSGSGLFYIDSDGPHFIDKEE